MFRTSSSRLNAQVYNLLRGSFGAATASGNSAAAGPGRMYISTNDRRSNTAATAEPQIGQKDKYLHYSSVEGYYKSSPYEAITPVNMPLEKYVWRNFNEFQNNVAAVCVVTGRQFTYAEMRDASAALAVRLQTKFQLGKGDVVAICLPNLPEYPVAALGAIEAGLTVTTVNPIYTAEEISRQLNFSEAKLIICTVRGFPVLQEACKLSEKKMPIACVRMAPNEPLPEGALDFAELIKADGVDFSLLKQYEFSPNDMVFLPFSSGTTGLPKGVMLTHNNITSNIEQLVEPLPLEPNDVVPCVLPFFHIYGLTVVMLSQLARGLKLVTLPQFKPEDLLKSLDDYKGSVLNLVPPIALCMINHPKFTPETTSAMRLVMSGAAPIGMHDVERFLKKFPKSHFLQGYGMTESSPVALLTPQGNTRYGSVGVLPGSTEAKIVHFDSTDYKGSGQRVTGELCVRGPQVMPGYLNNEEANKETFYPGGWLRTGDVAFYDEDGYFYITDRMKELIKVKGFQVPPAELEAALRDNPKILEAAVFGIPHEKNGEAPRAVVVLRPGQEATEEEIYSYVAERVAHYKTLEGGVLFVTEVPKSPTGKILRREVKAQYS